MKAELILRSTRIPGLVRSVNFTIREYEDLKEFMEHELKDEIEKLKTDEDKLLTYINGKGKKIRF